MSRLSRAPSMVRMLAIVASSLVASSNCFAENENERADRCKAYAQDAVQSANFEQQAHCYDDDSYNPRWSTDYDVHYNWCMNNPDADSVAHEQHERDMAGEACVTCASYADQAARDGYINIQNKCGFNPSDPRWSEDRQVHLRWCLGLKSSSRYVDDAPGQEEAAREAALKTCVPPPAPQPPPSEKKAHFPVKKLGRIKPRLNLGMKGNETMRRPKLSVRTKLTPRPCKFGCRGPSSSAKMIRPKPHPNFAEHPLTAIRRKIPPPPPPPPPIH